MPSAMHKWQRLERFAHPNRSDSAMSATSNAAKTLLQVLQHHILSIVTYSKDNDCRQDNFSATAYKASAQSLLRYSYSSRECKFAIPAKSLAIHCPSCKSSA